MSNNLHIHFQLNERSHEIDFTKSIAQTKNSVRIGGMTYMIKGDKESIQLVKKCLRQLPQASKPNLEQTGKELKAKLWQKGAKEISLSVEGTHKMGIRILKDVAPADLHKTVETICDSLEKYYVFPDIAKKSSSYLREQLQKGAYDGISDHETLAQAMTADIRKIAEDKHIFIDFYQPLQSSSKVPVGQIPERYPMPSLTHSYKFKSTSNIGWMGGTHSSFPYEIQSGLMKQNPKVGYVDLRIFGVCREKEPNKKIVKAEKHLQRLKEQSLHAKTGSAGRSKKSSLNRQIEIQEKQLETLKKADEMDLQLDAAARRKAIMAAVQNVKKADSIIIDLRNNGGGDPAAVQLLCSLFLNEDLPLNRIEWRKDDAFISEDFSTLTERELPHGKRLLDQRILILIGPHTFSAAEEFTNNMKIHQRATIIGEPSGGGANPGGPHQVSADFMIFIPEGRAVNPIQKGNWEGVGIIPDEVVPAKHALKEALLIATRE